MAEGYTEVEKLEILIAAAIEDAKKGSQGLFAYYEDTEKFFKNDSQGLFGISFDGLLKTGEEIWQKMSVKLQPVFCEKNSNEHKALAGLIQQGSNEVIPAIAAVITSAVLSLEIIPAGALTAVTIFLAKLIMKKFFEAAYETGCGKWKDYNENIS
jgi:hypothetical protein